MNAAIRQLANEAGLGIQHGGIVLTRDVNAAAAFEKFVELSVRECAQIAFDDWCEGTNESSSALAITKRFGVEI
jgi:hypothetical protein